MGGTVGMGLEVAFRVADRIILRRFRERLIGSRVRSLLAGSAPMSPSVVEWFHAMGLPLLEAYGVSENVVPIAMNRLGAFRFGSVGRPLSPNEVVLGDDGEVLVRGPGVCSGYVGTQDQIPKDGLYPTGDLGRFDEDGFLFLTGRKSELIKTSTGRRIAPLKMEMKLREIAGIDQAVVVGNGRKHLVALLTLDATGNAELDRRVGGSSADESARGRAAAELLQKHVDRLNGGLAPFERVARFAVLPRPLTAEGGELSQSLKLLRHRIEEKYRSLIDSLYDSDEVEARLEAARG